MLNPCKDFDCPEEQRANDRIFEEIFDDHGPAFIASLRHPVKNGVNIFGVPFDATVSFRPGSRFAPDAIRSCSDGLECYCPFLDKDLEDEPFGDLGNLPFTVNYRDIAENIDKAARFVLSLNGKFIMLGGDHSVTQAAFKPIFEKYPDVVLLQLDAHADLRDGYNGQHFSHASAMRRCLDFLSPDRLIQFGIRSGTREEYAEMRKYDRLAFKPEQLKAKLDKFPDAPIYLTIDLDVFDPSLFPGTGTPEFGGIDWHLFQALVGILSTRRIVSADVVELLPALDTSGCSAILASKVVRELLLIMR